MTAPTTGYGLGRSRGREGHIPRERLSPSAGIIRETGGTFEAREARIACGFDGHDPGPGGLLSRARSYQPAAEQSATVSQRST